MPIFNDARLKNPIIKVYWAGWQSNTHELQRNGWQLSIEEDFYSMRFRVALKHPQYKMYGISHPCSYDYQRSMNDMAWQALPEIPMNHMVSEMRINIMDNLANFKPIDAEPQIIHNEIKSIEDMKLFKPINHSKDIVIAPANVNELLESVLKQQDSKQMEIREKKRKEWNRFQGQMIEDYEKYKEQLNENNDIVAQIISLS
jgi:hypothetical protein